MPHLTKVGVLIFVAAWLTSCHATVSRSSIQRKSGSSPTVFVETLFASVPREALAELDKDTVQQLTNRPDSTVYSGGGALIELRDNFTYVPSTVETAPGGDLLETGSRNLRVGLQPRRGAQAQFDLRLESMPSFEHSVVETMVLSGGDDGALIDTQLTRDGKVLVVFVRAHPVQGRADLERIYAQKLEERAAAHDRSAPQPVLAPR